MGSRLWPRHCRCKKYNQSSIEPKRLLGNRLCLNRQSVWKYSIHHTKHYQAWVNQEKRRTSVQVHRGGSLEVEVEEEREAGELLEVREGELELDQVLRECQRLIGLLMLQSLASGIVMEVRQVCLMYIKADYPELSEEEDADDDEEQSSDLTEEDEDEAEKGSGDEDDDEEEDEEDDDEEEEEEQVTIGVPVGMWDFDHCDPKRCSGKKLERHRLMTSLRVGSRFRGIVLSYVSSSPSCDVYAEQ
jgi:hypothetical protein